MAWSKKNDIRFGNVVISEPSVMYEKLCTRILERRKARESLFEKAH